MNSWPKQSECATYYGNPDPDGNGVPDRAWEDANLTRIVAPWQMFLAWATTTPVKSILIHKRCAASLTTVLNGIWEYCLRSQVQVETHGLHLYGGAYNFRMMRGSTRLSMHAFGCAIDLDPAHNVFGSHEWSMSPTVINIFKSEGWVSGSTWSKPDAQHFQSAVVD